MALTSEWRERIRLWIKTLEKLRFRRLGSVELKAFFTTEQLRADQAVRRQFRPIKFGTAWGRKWEYGWFSGRLVLPEAVRGKQLVFIAELGGEVAVYVNGELAGGLAPSTHRDITLTKKAKPGTTYELLMEAYAGHGVRVCGNGPVPDGVETVPEPPQRQAVCKKAEFAVWNEDVYQLLMDMRTLFELRDKLDPESLRVAEIDAGLRDAAVLADLELPHEQMDESIRQARHRLAPLLACRNGSTAPTMYCFGHSHLDVAWLWPLRETESKCTRTLGIQLALMKEYPEFRYLQSQPHLFWMMKTHYPKIYERVRQAVRRGQLIPEGGMWVEADTNLIGGESLIRQFLHGKRFMREEFGVDSKMLWLPDVFGYSGALPQILKGCGVKYFSTAKIFWNYNGGEPFPYNSFWWEGIDGTRIFTHLHNDYNAHTNPAQVIGRWAERRQKDGLVSRLYPFGYGDGGGGVTRDHLEFLRREKDLEGVPKTKQCHPLDFFRDEENRGAKLPEYVGELYFQAHRGTYTTQARTKRGNRKSELALRDAELWSAMLTMLAGRRYPAGALRELWQLVLLNQFHDIIPGSSIAKVYEEAERDHARVAQEARRIVSAAVGALTAKAADSVTVFNSLSWERSALVPLPKTWRGAADQAGRTLPVQTLNGVPHAVVSPVPSVGWTTVRKAKPAKQVAALSVESNRLENEHLRLRLNAFGEIVSCFNKNSNTELVAGPLNGFRLYKDVPAQYDAWDIDGNYKLMPVPLPQKAKMRVVSRGPALVAVRVERDINNSKLVQEIRLAAGSRRVDFVTVVDWREKHKLLKVNFPVTVKSSEAVHEIQFGHVKRPAHQSRQLDVDRYEVSCHKWAALTEENRGVAILNDCKYGLDVSGNSINLTLLRSPLAPDMRADLGKQEFTYSLFVWDGPFLESDVVRQAYELNVPVTVQPGDGGEQALLEIDRPEIILETVKLAEDGKGLVLRLYEAKRARVRCRVRPALPIASAVETDMLEENPRPLKLRDGELTLEFRPFEIKTIRLSPEK
jgi:alpha-mannosidase